MELAVAFRREDEITLGEAVDLVREDHDAHLSPREEEIRVVLLFLGHSAHAIDEGQSLREIAERVRLLEVMRILYQRYGIESQGQVTTDQIQAVAEEVSGTDFSDFFDDFIYGTAPLPLDGISFDWVCHG